MTSKVITVQLLDKMPDEGGVNVMTREDNIKISEALARLPGSIHRNYWILVLSEDREVETHTDFMKRLKAEIKKWNAQQNAEIAQHLDSKSKASYVA